jgi:hypothetical protein
MKSHNAKEDNNIDRLLLFLLLDSNRTETVNTLIRGNANNINTANAKDNEKFQKVNWWINELDSLGIKKGSNNVEKNESNGSQELEDLTDDIKQKFIYDYKSCYSE